MIPSSEFDFSGFSFETPTSKTWHIDFEKNRVVGTIDEIEAVRQAVYIILSTERYKYLIYDASFGSELGTLIHRPYAVAMSEAKRMITDALRQDDRITDVTDFEITRDGTRLIINATIHSVYGEIDITTNAEVKT